MSTLLYETDKVSLTQFSAGAGKGVQLQLTLLDRPFIDKGYVQLTKAEAVALSEALHDWAISPDKKYPSGEDG